MTFSSTIAGIECTCIKDRWKWVGDSSLCFFLRNHQNNLINLWKWPHHENASTSCIESVIKPIKNCMTSWFSGNLCKKGPAPQDQIGTSSSSTYSSQRVFLFVKNVERKRLPRHRIDKSLFGSGRSEPDSIESIACSIDAKCLAQLYIQYTLCNFVSDWVKQPGGDHSIAAFPLRHQAWRRIRYDTGAGD